ncbi:N-acetylneuraminate synthase [Chloroflexota bacterium]
MKIGNRLIGPNEPCFIVAEAGVNHNGDINLAKKLIDAAKEAGVDAVKFQTFKAEELVTKTAEKAAYQLHTTDATESQLEMLQRLELPAKEHRELQIYCQKRDILFLSTPFDEGSVDLLDELGVPVFKISSGEITNWPFLKYIVHKKKPVILSTGMSFLSEVDEAVRVIRQAGCDQLVLLHCVSEYPAALADVNLRAMQTMAIAFQVPVGCSDHTPGIEIAVAAVALGACVFEKHFTLDKNLPGPDHRASLEPQELRALVTEIRTVELALGNGVKRPVQSETNNRLIVRRSLAAASNIPKGTIFTQNILRSLRPANGISPTLIEHVIGRKARRSLMAGQLIAWGDLE